MTNRRRLWPVVTALLISLPVLYVASWGPVNWIALRLYSRWGWWPDSAQWLYEAIYSPLDRLISATPDSFGKAMAWYMKLGEP